MEIGASGNAEYRTIDPGSVDTHFSLDFHTVDALDPECIAQDLEARSNDIRSQIFHRIANEVIPGMVRGHEGGEAPEQFSINSESSGTSTMTAPQIVGGALNTDHHMEIDFSFRADQEIDPATMIFLARNSVASHIADGIVFDLEHRFLGKTSASVASDSSTKEGVVVEYRVAEEGPQEAPDPVSGTVQNTPMDEGRAANDEEFILDMPEIPAAAGEWEGDVNKTGYDRPFDYEKHAKAVRKWLREDEELFMEARAWLMECWWNWCQAWNERRWPDAARWELETEKAQKSVEEQREIREINRKGFVDFFKQAGKEHLLAA